MKKLSMPQFDEAYQLFEESFVLAELRPYQQMKSLFEKGLFHIYGEYQDEQLMGALIVWELETCVYLENFAVSAKARGQGLGTRFIHHFRDLYHDRFLFMEVEEPFDEISKRRIHFYEKNDYILNPFHYIQPPFRKDDPQVKLTFMTYPEIMNEEQYQDIKDELFRVVYQKGEL